MEITEMQLVYFSPTGSTRTVVRYLGEVMGFPSRETDVTLEAEARIAFTEKELVCFGVPSYGGRVPAVAMKRLSRLRGNNTPAILIATFGNRAYEDTLLELAEGLELNGFVPIAAAAVATEHSILHQFGEGRPNKEDREQLKSFALGVKKKIQEIKRPDKLQTEFDGQRPYRKYGGVPMKPGAGKNCVYCGKCAAECPVGAVDKRDPSRTDKRRCISCLRCVKICPGQARAVHPFLLFVAGQKMKKACIEPKDNALFL